MLFFFPETRPSRSNSRALSASSVSCPLCQENFDGQDQMEEHAMSVHSVNAEGLQRLQSLINGSHWLNKAGNSQDDSANNNDRGKRQHYW